MSTQIPLLNLTPVYLQNTDNIVNTLIFMNLDQGHDFHDGSARTKTNSGNSTWVDLDVKGKGFLNQIKRNIFNEKYKEDGEFKLLVEDGDIFGNYDFIKGSLNTTFVGGNGTYGMVIIDEENLKKFSNLNEVEENIIKKIKSEIKIKIVNLADKIYFVAEGDTSGEYGKTFQIMDGNESIKFLFLPFYQRVYNTGMHKLWTFNTIKHIYLIKINELSIKKMLGTVEIIDTNFICEKYNTINQIVPQYFLNYKDFLNKKDNSFIKRLKNKLEEENLFNQYENLFIKNFKTIDFEKIPNLPENIQKIIFEIFISSLIRNDSEINNEVDNSSNLSFDKEKNKFILKVSNSNFLEYLPRGVKYHFETCGDKSFRYFLNLLYLYQKPFIHPEYKCENIKIEKAKNVIFNKLNEKLLLEYNELKTNKQKISNDDENFISKQYGFITDTNIGSNQTESTADYLINSLNNTINKSEKNIDIQFGGQLEDFPSKTQRFFDNIIKVKGTSRQDNATILINVKKILSI